MSVSVTRVRAGPIPGHAASLSAAVTMLSFMIPTEEKGFNLTTTQNEVFQVSSSHGEIKTELSAPVNGSPNNNTHPALTAMTSALDNAAGAPPPLPSQPPPPLPLQPFLPHEVSLMMEDSYSDDTATESTLLLRPDDHPQSEITIAPSPDNTGQRQQVNTGGSPAAEDRQPLLPAATVTGKSGKLKR